MRAIYRVLLGLVAGMCLSAAVGAQNVSVGSASGNPGGGTVPAQVPVTFTRNPAVPVADFAYRVTYNTAVLDATVAGINGGGCSVNDSLGRVTALPPAGLTDVPTNVYCNITFTIAPAAPVGAQALTVVVAPGGDCIDANAVTVTCSTTNGTITVVAPSLGPSLAYNPAAGASAGTGGPVNFTGVTTAGSTGNGQIVVTPSGGTAPGTTTLGAFTLSGADAASFAVTSGATLTFTAGVNTPQNITLTCTSSSVARSANLQATETITGGATSQRFWVLNCPAGALGPALAYNPAAGASAGTGGPVNFTGVTTSGSTGNGQIVATPSGGAVSGTTTLTSFTLTGADAASFTRTSAATLTFTAGVNIPQNITLTCTSSSVARTANLQATETVTGGATSTRFWVLNCPAGALGPSMAYNPAAGASAGTGGPVNFTGVTTVGTVGNGQIVATPAGGAVSGTTTVGSFTLSGADAASFALTSAATLTFTAGVNTPQNITLTCTSGSVARTANLQATETITGGATSSRFWVLSCPAGALGPSMAYNPAAGASAGTGGPVNFTGVTTSGSTGNGQIVATPSGGAASGTTTLTSFTLSGADAASFTRTSAATLTFTAGVNTPQNITLTCTSSSVARTANLQATETIAGGATSTRFWVLNCPAGALGPSMAYNPAAGASAGTGGPVNFIGVTTVGTVGNGQIVATPSGGAVSGTTTLGSFTLSGADAANFALTSAATLTFTAGVNTPQNVTLTCTSGAVIRTANLQATETIAGGATSSRFWVLSCPAGTPVPLGPSLAYNPAAGASAGTGGPVNFSGVTTVGTIGNGQIVATPSGGAVSATTTLGAFSITGADAASFSLTSAATLTFTAGVNTPQNVTLTCVSAAVPRAANLQATETITGGATSTRFWVLNCPAGGAVPLGPSMAYNPVAGASAGTGGPVSFTGVTTTGTTGNGQIVATPSGGAASGTTTLGSFTITGADAASFTRTSAATLTFTAGVNTPQNITLTCTSSTVARTANLQATETITGGATSTRFWVLNCPAGALGPSLAYNPAAGASAGTGGPVNFTGVTTAGTTGTGQIVATPSGGAVSGTTTLGSFTITGADAANFALTSAATLTFTAGVNTPQNVTLTCTSGSVARTANLQATETITGGATSSRFWVLSCPAGALGPSMAYNPAAGASAGTGGPVNFSGVTTAGSTGNGQIVATPSGGAVSGTTTLGSFTISGADAASFARTSAATLTFTAGVNTPQNVTLTCTAGSVARTANLQATETVAGGATSTRFWVLSCPAGAQGPTLAYNPAAGASAGTGGPVNFTGITTVGTTGNGQIVATPSGGAVSGTTTLGSFTITGADAANFALTSAATLTFTAGVNTPQNVTLTCVSGAAPRSANLQATETVSGGATSTRFWVLSCGAGGAVGPGLAYSPAAGATAGTGGPVNFTGVTTVGSNGSGVITATPSGGAASGTTTLSGFTLSGADAANFTVTSAATLTFTAGNNTPQNITLSCTSGATLRNANLQLTETVAGGAVSQRFWALVCPAGSALPLGPSIAYNPAAGASAGTGGPVSFTGVGVAGSPGSGLIIATPSGGAAAATTTLGSFTITGADAANFALTSAATLTFTAGVATPQNVTMTCISGAAARSANLQATETITGGATSQRFWVLSCPFGPDRLLQNGFETPDLMFVDGFEDPQAGR